MATRKTSLACVDCGSRNYSKTVNDSNRAERLEIKKFCKYCKKHTQHKETK